MFDTQTLNTCTWIELNILYPLTGHAILGYLIINFMFDVASHRGNLQLTAANLGSSGIQLFPYGLKKVEKLSATLHSIDNKPLNSHVYFADDRPLMHIDGLGSML
ncbi:protein DETOXIFICATION [Trifolium repens]|nr:protein DETOXIFICATION [Trifolium repens]